MSYASGNPGHGNTSEIHGFSVNQTSRVTHCADVSSRLAAILNSEAAASWQSASATAWRERMVRVIPTIDAAGAVAHDWAAAAQKYCDRLTTMTSQAATANHDINTAHSMLHAYEQMPPEITSTPQYVRNTHAYETDIREGHQTLQYLESLRYGDDATCVYALNARGTGGSFTQWLSLQAMYGDAKSVADIRDARDALLSEYSELAAKIASGDASDEDIARFSRFMDGTAADPILASEFWLELGGEETRNLLVKLGYRASSGGLEDLEALRAIASRIRESLSVGSAGWTEDEASAFAESLFFEAGPMSGLDAISYLFNDPEDSPMGAEFTVATATIFDQWERDPTWLGNGPVLVEMGGSPPLGLVMFMENEDLGMWNATGVDPMSRVLETLGLYPDDALAWLTEGEADPYWDSRWDEGSSAPTAGEARIDYWFGERAWQFDGFTGAGALWDGALSATGGVRDAGGDPGSQVVIDQMIASTNILDALGGAANTTFIPEALAPGAQLEFGQSLATLLPRLAEVPMDQVALASDVDRGYAERAILGTTDMIPVPAANKEDFTRVWGAVASTPNGLVLLDTAVGGYADQLQLVGLSGAPGAPTVLDAFTRIAELEGFHQGSVGGAQALQGMRQDVAFQQAMDTVELGLALIPIPGLGDIPGVSSFLAETGTQFAFDMASGMAEGAIKDAALARWGEGYVTALDSAAASDLAGQDALGATLDKILDTDNAALMAGIGAREQAPGETAANYSMYLDQAVDQFVADRVGDYGDQHAAALALSNQDVYESYDEARKEREG